MPGQAQSEAEERRQCPECVPGVGGDESWQVVGVTAGTDTQSGNQGDQDHLDEWITSSKHGHQGVSPASVWESVFKGLGEERTEPKAEFAFGPVELFMPRTSALFTLSASGMMRTAPVT